MLRATLTLVLLALLGCDNEFRSTRVPPEQTVDVQAQADAAALRRELSTQRARIAELERELRDAKVLLAVARERNADEWDDYRKEQQRRLLPTMRGSVRDVRVDREGRQHRVNIALATPTPVPPETEFIIFRADTFVVRVRVMAQEGEVLVCDTIAESWNTAGESIRVGDEAVNKVY